MTLKYSKPIAKAAKIIANVPVKSKPPCARLDLALGSALAARARLDLGGQDLAR